MSIDLHGAMGSIPTYGASTLDGFDYSQVTPGQRLRGINRQMVRFYKKKFPQVYATEVKVNEKTGSTQVLKTGIREVEREMVLIVTPGDTNTVEDFAEDYHRREHWGVYKAFRDGRGAPIGMPLEEATFISSNLATELKYLGVHTVEQLADSSDVLCNQVGDGWNLREFARATVKANMDNKQLAQVNALRNELDEAKKMISEMRSQMSQGPAVTSSEDVSNSSEIRRGPGRPKKIITDEMV